MSLSGYREHVGNGEEKEMSGRMDVSLSPSRAAVLVLNCPVLPSGAGQLSNQFGSSSGSLGRTTKKTSSKMNRFFLRPPLILRC